MFGWSKVEDETLKNHGKEKVQDTQEFLSMRKSSGLLSKKKKWEKFLPAVQVFGESPLTREPARKDFAALDYWIVIFIEYYSNTALKDL